jgi:hypothetical protein
MLYADTYMSHNRQLLTGLKLPADWKRQLPDRTGFVYDFTPSRWLDDIVVTVSDAKTTPSPLKFKVRGNDIFLWGESTVKCGKYQVIIDGGTPKEYNAGNKNGNWRYLECIAENLPSGVEHSVEIIPQLEAGQELHFESLCVAGDGAKVRVE